MVMKDGGGKQKHPQGKPARELTAEQKRKVEDTIRKGLTGADTYSEIHKAVNEALGFGLAPPAFKKILEEVREGFLIGAGICRESLQLLAESAIRETLTDKEASHEKKMAAIDRGHRLFDLRRRPEEDREAISKVVEMEMTRIRGLSDEGLASYAELLKDARLDDEFASAIEAYKRGRIFAIEQGEVIEKATHTYNITHKPRVRKVQKRKPKPPQDGQGT
jgi:hypothetical protein